MSGKGQRDGARSQGFDCQTKEFGLFLVSRRGSSMRLKRSELGKDQ